ncbi:ABC transporter permease [Luteimonas sp. A478]
MSEKPREGGIALSTPLSAWLMYPTLTWEMIKRDITGRYRGASFGLLWSLISPFLMLGVYTIAFGFVLKARWPGASDSTTDFAMLLFIGLIVHGFFAECLTRAPSLIIGNTNLVKKIVFPLDILSWVVVSSALFHAVMNFAVYALLEFLIRGSLDVKFLLLPIILAPLIMVCLGMVWILSALSVYLRDIGQVTGVVATAMLFLSSAIIPVESLPTSYQRIFLLNPLTFIIDQARNVAFWGRLPDFQGLMIYSFFALLFACVGFGVFQKMRRGFADVV